VSAVQPVSAAEPYPSAATTSSRPRLRPAGFRRLLVASNRLPVVLERGGNRNAGRWQARPASGGLVTALAPVLRRTGGLWVGWPGVDGGPGDGIAAALDARGRDEGFSLRPVGLSAEEVDLHYRGFCNEVLWPLFHDLPARCNFDPVYRDAYEGVNRRFAEVLAREARPGDLVWVHDYHLAGVAAELRRAGRKDLPIAYFLHTPFPPPDLFLSLPWREELIDALLAHDLVGFQTDRDLDNFARCVATLRPERSLHTPADGRARRPAGPAAGPVHAGAFPISIDFDEFAGAAAAPAVAAAAERLRREVGARIVLGVDRLDYSKGLPLKLRAFAAALERRPELVGRATLVQVVVPSREGISAYGDLKRELERLVGEIDGRWSRPGWQPVRYLYRSLSREELLAWYRAADAALVTPTRDGMNLVAKEYCAAHGGPGELILSEFAGAAVELAPADGRGAARVNPYDVSGVAEAIYRALTRPEGERRQRMRWLRERVRRADVYRWVDRFVAAARDAAVAPRAKRRAPAPFPRLLRAPARAAARSAP